MSGQAPQRGSRWCARAWQSRGGRPGVQAPSRGSGRCRRGWRAGGSAGDPEPRLAPCRRASRGLPAQEGPAGRAPGGLAGRRGRQEGLAGHAGGALLRLCPRGCEAGSDTPGSGAAGPGGALAGQSRLPSPETRVKRRGAAALAHREASACLGATGGLARCSAPALLSSCDLLCRPTASHRFPGRAPAEPGACRHEGSRTCRDAASPDSASPGGDHLLVPQLPANPVECQDNEYLDDHGKCSPCRECGPGLELSKECGYGEGNDAHCTPCQPRRFKDSWGHSGCKPCLSCRLINRVQRSNCTATSDAVCGECFPGFYSKTQIGGLRDLECVPCTKQTPSSELQCRSRVSLVKVESPPAPTQDLALVVLTSSALAVISLVLLTISILYCRRFWKSQCQRVFLASQDSSGQRVLFQASAIQAGFSCHEQLSSPCCLGIRNLSPCQRPQEAPGDAVQFVTEAGISGFRLPHQQPDLDASKLISSRALPARSSLETQPLLRNSGCSECSAGSSSFPEFRQDSGGDPGGPAPLSSCATEMQSHWPHAPVECTELDLQTFSSQAEFTDSESQDKAAQRGTRGRPELTPEGPACHIHPVAPASLSWESSQASCSSFRNPTAESGEQLGDNVWSLVTEIGDITQGLPISSLPDSLVLSLALLLDSPLPGLRNFSHLGIELGVPSHQLSQISGFKELVAYLHDAEDTLPVLTLACALQRLQHLDALLLLHDHFTGSPAQDIQR
ncbi:tumor necrosis factor receptor superfamily member 27 [Tiliqua scincoides]|uniref:tumor necrosis factor receptor superfamily member 27 n=1 Tax=Tiliqua scincoides TaxID=71010 RepID=UPI003462F9BD